jgi:hypothetical protein
MTVVSIPIAIPIAISMGFTTGLRYANPRNECRSFMDRHLAHRHHHAVDAQRLSGLTVKRPS